MFTYPRTLDPTYYGSDAGSQIVHLLTESGGRSVSHVRANALTTPTRLTISHDSRQSNGFELLGHLAKVDQTLIASNGEKVVVSASIVLKVPSDPDITDQLIENALALACRACMDSSLPIFVAGEV